MTNHYDPSYHNDDIRSKKYDIFDHIESWLPCKVPLLVDLGCGTGRKTVQLSKHAERLVAFDINPSMVSFTRKTFFECGAKIAEAYVANNLNTPLKTSSAELVTAFLTTYSVAEVQRILRPRGIFILETLGAMDKRDLKKAFGRDELGWRGSLLDTGRRTRMSYITKRLRPLFDIEDIRTVSFRTSLKLESIVRLLEMTPTVRGFPTNGDLRILQGLSKGGQIEFQEERILVAAVSKSLDRRPNVTYII